MALIDPFHIWDVILRKGIGSSCPTCSGCVQPPLPKWDFPTGVFAIVRALQHLFPSFTAFK